MEFGSLAALAEHFMAETVGEAIGVQRGLERAAALIKKTAKEEIGHYQEEIAMFPAWAPLAAATEEQKARMGYPANAPLLATGELRESIVHEVGVLEATVGSIDPVMEYHEFGTSRMPARPVIGPALYRNLDAVQRLVGEAAVAGFIGGELMANDDPAHAGYTFNVSEE